MSRAGIVLVASGAPTTVERTLESLQNQGSVELVYVENRSATESSPRIDALLTERGAKRLKLPGQGRAEVWNLGLAELETDFVTFIDAGQVVADGALSTLSELLAADPNLGGCYGRTAVIDGEAQLRYRPEHGKTGSIFHRLLDKKHFLAAPACVLFRRAALGEGFDAAYKTPRAVFLKKSIEVARARPFRFCDRAVVTATTVPDDLGVLEELVKVLVMVLYGFEPLRERSEHKLRKRLARQLVALGKYHYRRERTEVAGRYISEAVRIAPAYFKGRRYQFLNFVKELRASTAEQ